MAYGDKRDYPVIEIAVYSEAERRWLYAGSTTWSRTCGDAVRHYQAIHTQEKVRASFKRDHNNRKVR